MEQCSRKRAGASEDRISELPEALILQILSLLPTKIVIATSVLSKRWQPLWKMVSKLEFESYGLKFAENVSRSLLSHKALVLESFHMKVRDRCGDIYIGMWAGIAFTRHVREFVLDLSFLNGDPVRFPSCLFYSDTLVTLKLKNFVLLDVPSPVLMKSLRTLHLKSVVYKDEESVHNLFASCPNLEHLVVHRGFLVEVEMNFIIEVPSLKTLSLYDYSNGLVDAGYAINAPLRSLEIERLKGYDFCLIENASKLVEANIRNVSYIVDETILGSLKSTKRLSLDLSPLEITYPTGVVFYHLVYLEMYTHKPEWWNLLTLMIDSSPKLQVLKLIDESLDFDKHFVVSGKWNQPKFVPECLLYHLETFVWKRFDWEREEEKEVASYILRNARHLKKATFSTGPIESKEKLAMLKELNGMVNKLEERRKVLNELASVVRASNSCHVSFECE